MGDVAMTVPVLRCLIKKYPNSKITIVSKAIYKPIFREFENIRFFKVDFKFKYKGLRGLFNRLKKNRSKKKDSSSESTSAPEQAE